MNKLVKTGLLTLSIITLSFTVQSCDTTKNIVSKVENKDLGNQLAGTWTLKSIEGTDVQEAFDKARTTPSITFNLEENKVNGSTGCNNYNGGFTLLGNTFTPTPMASTKMACGNGTEEYKLLEFLGKKSTLIFNNYTLQFVQNGKVVLEFTSLKR